MNNSKFSDLPPPIFEKKLWNTDVWAFNYAVNTIWDKKPDKPKKKK